MKKNSIEKGVSLLEMLLVLVIAIIFIIMSMRYYKSYEKTRDIGFFQTSVSELMGALNNYYFMNCRDDSSKFADIKIKTLQEAKLVGNKLNNPWGSFSVKIENMDTSGDLAKKFYVLRVIAAITDPNNTLEQNLALAAYLRGALNADVMVEKKELEVIWTRLPLNTRDDLSSHQWIFDQGPGRDFMPGRYMTAVNTGTGSKFWILNSNLQSFANADKNYATNCPN